jgi:AraC-like DNA-binding protein
VTPQADAWAAEHVTVQQLSGSRVSVVKAQVDGHASETAPAPHRACRRPFGPLLKVSEGVLELRISGIRAPLDLFYPRPMVIAELEKTEERESTDRRGVSPCQGARTVRREPARVLVGEAPRNVVRGEIIWSWQDSAGSGVAVATTDLIRALVASAIDDDQGPQEACGEALWSLVLAYVDAHLTEHDLSAARIAAAVNISPRYLYKLCARHDLRLREWIIERRLRGARRELEGLGSRTVATIARRWGFVDPAHFSGRFRHAFEMSPRECRNLARERGLNASSQNCAE